MQGFGRGPLCGREGGSCPTCQSSSGLHIVPALRPYVRAAGALDGSWGAEPLSQLGPAADDLSVVKTGSGAFTGSDLDAILRRLAVRTILYAGVVTSACVLLTACVGFDLGYRQYLISDCTASLSDQDQCDAERLMGVYVAEIVTAAETLIALQSAGSLKSTQSRVQPAG
jgi:biuret amidohydrolase